MIHSGYNSAPITSQCESVNTVYAQLDSPVRVAYMTLQLQRACVAPKHKGQDHTVFTQPSACPEKRPRAYILKLSYCEAPLTHKKSAQSAT